MALALTAISIDFWFSARGFPVWMRAVLAMAVLAVYLMSGVADCKSLGIRMRPIQPVSYWIRITVILAVLMLVPILTYAGVAKSLGWGLTIPRIAPDQAISVFLHMIVIAPIVEESIYRLVLCFPTTAVIGSTGTIILSGTIFAGLHFVYGNPSPDNCLAGYVLTWAYLKSGSLLVPITLHSLGNCVAFAVQLGAWYAT